MMILIPYRVMPSVPAMQEIEIDEWGIIVGNTEIGMSFEEISLTTC